MKNLAKLLLFPLFLLILNSCATWFKPADWTPQNAFRPTPITNIKFIDDPDDLPALYHALDMSLQYYATKAETDLIHVGQDTFTVPEMKSALIEIKAMLQQNGLNTQFYDYLHRNFNSYIPYDAQVFFTAYCMPTLRGSFERSNRYCYPLYKLPDDLVSLRLKDFPVITDSDIKPNKIRGRLTDENKVVPYYTRSEIDFGNTLTGKSRELCWVDNLGDWGILK